MSSYSSGYYDLNDWSDQRSLLESFDNNQRCQRNHQIAKIQDIDYTKIEKTIILPKEIKILQKEKIFNGFQKFDSKQYQVPQKIQILAQQIKKQLQDIFMIWDQPIQFRFKFPDSKFEPIPDGQVNSMNYQQKFDTQEEDTFKPKLSSEQLKQIAQKGQFQVKSNNELITLPYVWKINEILFRGTEINHKNWLKGLGTIYSLFSNAWRMIKQGIPRQIIVLSKIPKRVFSLIFGKKKHQTIYQVDYDRQVKKDFFDSLYDQYYKFDKGWQKQFWSQIFIDYDHNVHKAVEFPKDSTYQERQQLQNQKFRLQRVHDQKVQNRSKKINQYQKIDAQFSNKWAKVRKRIIKQTSIKIDQKIQKRAKEENNHEEARLLEQMQQKEKQQIIHEVVQGRKFTLYISYLKQQLPKIKVKNQVIESIVKLLYLFQLINLKKNHFNKNKDKIREQIKQKIKLQHTIKSLSNTFMNNQFQKRYSKLYQQMDKDFYQGLLSDKQFIDKTSQEQRQIYKKYLFFKKNYTNLVKQKKDKIKDLNIPARVFYTTYQLLPPYKIIQTKQVGGQTNYLFKKYEQMTIDTSTHFWKIKLYIMRIKSWTINCFVFLIRQALYGPFGLRCLVGVQKFTYDEYIGYNNGIITSYKRDTLIGVFKTVLQGIRKSRQNFQATPDRGLFGKKFSRVINLIECYFFRLIFVGLFLVVMMYPIAIILNAVISTILVLTVWIWVPFIMLICYIFNILVFQFQSSHIPYGVAVRSVPLASLIYVLLRSAILVAFYIVNLIIISPICSILIFIFRLIQRIFRGITDTIMFYLIKFLGRTPSRNTAIAWKISGPGMSKQYYMSINEQDVYILTQSELQKLYVSKFYNLAYNKINKHQARYIYAMNTFMSPYINQNQLTYTVSYSNIITTNHQYLRQNLDTQYRVFMNRYPRNPYNVRFTQQQINAYFDNSIQIVKNFVKKYDCQDWIFDELQIQKGAYDQLTNNMWTRIFGCGQQIFDPLQKIDQRFKFQDLYKEQDSHVRMKQNVYTIMNALQGQVNLKKQRAHIGHFSPGINHINPQIYTLASLSCNSTNNSINGIYLDLYDINSAFFPQMNIKEAIKYDQYNYDYIKRTRDRIIIGNINRKD